MSATLSSQSLLWTFVLFTSLFSCQVSAYPVFGTKRYGRSVTLPTHRIPSWAPLPLQPYQAPPPSTPNHFLAPSYYTDYPYGQDYDTDYFYPADPVYNTYPQAPLPYYPGPNDNMKYAVYHSMLPYYYDTRRPGYGYYGYDDTSDPVDDVHEEMLQDEEREERGDALPIGQETWFENENAGGSQQQSQDSMADVNAAFLQNLIISQMYNDRENALRQQQLRLAGYGMEGSDDWIYGDPRREAYYSDSDDEDEDVRELKSLVKKSDQMFEERFPSMPMRRDGNEADYVGRPVLYPSAESSSSNNNKNNNINNKRSNDVERIFGPHPNKERSDQWQIMNEGPISITDRKGHRFPGNGNDVHGLGSQTPTVETVKASTVAPAPTPAITVPTTEAPDFDPRRGQKEVPLLRPAPSPRRPMIEDIMDRMLQGRSDRPRAKPSVFDTIKQLLTMEEGLNEKQDSSLRSQPQKRFITNEQSLVKQLGGLKKNSA